MRRIQRYTPIAGSFRVVDPRIQSWLVDETYARVAGHLTCVYRSVDPTRCAIRFYVVDKWDLTAAILFLHLRYPQRRDQATVVNVDGHQHTQATLPS